MKFRTLFVVCLLTLFVSDALAQKMPVHVFAGGGGKSTNNEMSHFSAVGIGMAVGTASGGGVEAHHGFLAGAQVFADSDIVPPEFDPQPQNLRFAVREADCLAPVVFPAYTVTDDRDPNPAVTVTIVDPLTDINPAGETKLLPPGSYDVVLVVTDRQGNETRAAIRVDVVDESSPVIDPIPNPTPNNASAIEATSPTGTPVALDIRCQDSCDAEPVVLDVPAKFPLGETDVPLVCRDRSGNERQENVTIRIKDTTAPQVVGELPDSFDVLCNNAGGAIIQVPFVVFSDNASRPNEIAVGLVVDPGTDNEEVYQQVPNTVTLLAGRHTLRYLARDAQNNVQVADLVVEVKDETAPRIDVAGLPDSGWFNLDDAEFEFTVRDDCGAADQLDVSVAPVPDNIQRDGNTYTVTYENDGLYNLQIAVTDTGNNTARDNSVSFGVDKTKPEHVFVTPTGNAPGATEESYTFYGMGEQVPMTFAARDAGGDNASGIAYASVLIPATNMTLFTFNANGQGRPLQGDGEVDNLRCNTNQVINGVPVCEDGKINMKLLPPGVVQAQFEITDFAGNTAYENVSFINGNLGAGLRRVQQKLQSSLQQCPTCPVVVEGDEAQQVGVAINKLAKATCDAGFKCLSNEIIDESDFQTLRFLGGAIRVAERTSINLVNLMNGTDNDDKKLFYRTQLETLARMTLSDIELYKEWIVRINPAAQQNAAFYGENYDRDMAKLTDEINSMKEGLNGRNYPQVFSSGLKAFFHVKMAHELWVMNYHAQPEPQAEINNEGNVSFNYTEYRRGRDILQKLADELSIYESLTTVPALDEMRSIRVRLSGVVADLNLLLDEGINDGLTDIEYLDSLLELRSVARSSATASNQGAYVRVYQLAMMQVVRWLTHFSLATAMYFDPVDQPVYAAALQSMNEGVELLDDREVAGVINLYGDVEKALCPILGVYHCFFTRDDFLVENGNDTDPRYDLYVGEEFPAECLDIGMTDPATWDNDWRIAMQNGDEIRQPCRIDVPEE